MINRPHHIVERRTLSGGKLGIPEIDHLGCLNYSKARSPLSDHKHGGCMEICFLAKGRQSYFVGKKEFTLSGGDIFVTFPDEKHSSGKKPEEKSILYWIILDVTSKSKSFLGLSPLQSKELKDSLLNLRRRHFKATPTLTAVIEPVFGLAENIKHPNRKLWIENRIVHFLLQVIYYCNRAENNHVDLSVAKALEFIDNYIHEKIGVPSLAISAGLSIPRLKVIFRQKTGIPPGEFILRRKIEKAKEILLSGNGSITETAFDLGFSSSQYFATTFKRYTGMNPRQLIKSNRD